VAGGSHRGQRASVIGDLRTADGCKRWVVLARFAVHGPLAVDPGGRLAGENSQFLQLFAEILPAEPLDGLQNPPDPAKREPFGEMAEWLKAHAWKACVRETVPWVRIPLSPPVLWFHQMSYNFNMLSNAGAGLSPIVASTVSPNS
jgi:hypothetical protein